MYFSLIIRTLPLHDSAKILAIRTVEWQKQITEVREWYQKEHDNWVVIDGDRSKWWVWREAVQQATTSVERLQDYLDKIDKGDKRAAFVSERVIHFT